MFDSSIQFSAGHAIGAAEKAKIFQHSEVTIETEALRHITKLGAHPLPLYPDVKALDRRITSGRMCQAAQHSHGGRFACTVWADETKDGSSLDCQGELLHGMNIPVTLAQVVEHDHRFAHAKTLLR